MDIQQTSKTKIIWNKKAVLDDALKYQSRSDWKKASYGYEVAVKNGWLEESCLHMRGGKGVYQKGYWTLERCIDDAKKHPTKVSWRNSNGPSGYVVAKNNGWLEQCCAHMVDSKKPNGYWKSFENCIKDAQRFKYQVEWEKESPSAVNSARKNGWLELCTEHMEVSAPHNLKWSKEAVLQDASSYQTIGEWRSKSPGAYSAANRTGWIKDATSHMTLVLSQGEYQIYRFLLERDINFETQKRFPGCKDITYLPFDFYLPKFNLLIEFQGIQHIRGYRGDREDAKRIAKRDAIKKNFAKDNKFEFLEIWSVSDIEKDVLKKLKEISALQNQDLNLKVRNLTPDEIESLKTIGIWTLEKCIEDARQYDTKSSWMKNSLGGYTAAHKNKWIDICSKHMTVLWEKKWSLETCKLDALKYATKNEWQQKSPNAYTAAHRKKWLDECTSHMKEGRRPNGYWSLEKCIDDAKNYSSKKLWRIGSPSGYTTAKSKGWIPICCAHMDKLG